MNTSWTTRSRYDAVVVGARAAGASTALLLARMGVRVLVVDRSRPGSDTLSTHALMRGGVMQLHRWGLLDGIVDAGTPPIRTATFHYGDRETAVPIKPRDGIDALVAPRRTVLDPALVKAARAAGAEVAYGVRALDLIRDASGRVVGLTAAGPDGIPVRIEAALVIGADGVRSRTARLAGAEVEVAGRHTGAVIYGYWAGLDLAGYHWHYRPGVSVGVIPTNDGQTCVFASMPPERFQSAMEAGGLDALYRRVLSEASPALAEAVDRARPAGRLHPFPGRPGFLRRPWGPGWALVGDAGYFRDPITAHGITDALRDAETLARAVARGTDAAMEDYRTARDAGAVGILAVTDAIAAYDWDLEQVQELHLELSRLMAAEVESLRALGPAPGAAVPVGATGGSSATAPRSGRPVPGGSPGPGGR